MGQQLEYRRLRAPREDGQALVEPPLAAAGDLIERNAELRRHYDADVQGRSLAQLAASAHEQLAHDAWQYTSRYRQIARPALTAGTPILLAGHQPQLFHPGVWYKNFVLSALARQHGGVAVNLVIDSDTIKTATVRVPGGSVDRPQVQNIPLDEPTSEIPYEERGIVNNQTLASFGTRAAEWIAPLVPQPLVRQFWPLVTERARECSNLGLCLAQARHQQEGLWGAVTLELPQSRICQFEAFHWFTSHLLARLPRLWDAYNGAVAEYRRVNHVRSASHPVPDLAMADDWLEAPLWIWQKDNPRRRRLFVRQRGDEIVLADRQGLEVSLPLTPEGDGGRAAERLMELEAQGTKLRTRALVTTMFARLFLGDVFLHGIGGAKYDQVTDLLINRFFGVEPPGYMTVTATLRLPVERAAASSGDIHFVERRQRELTFHPERFLNGSIQDAGVRELIHTKGRWIATPQTRENARQRCHAIREANQSLQPWLEDQRRQLEQQHQAADQALRGQAILLGREYAFCLYPESKLRALLAV